MKVQRCMTNKQGFTLLELLMVVIIVGILASLALPGYIRAAEQARGSEAVTALGQLKGAAQRYCLQSNGVAPGAYSDLDMENPNSNPQFLARWGDGAGGAAPFPPVACATPLAVFNFTGAFLRQAGPCTGSRISLTSPPPAAQPQEIAYQWVGACT